MKPTNAASIEKVEAALHAVMTELAKKRELAAEAKTQPFTTHNALEVVAYAAALAASIVWATSFLALAVIDP